MLARLEFVARSQVRSDITGDQRHTCLGGRATKPLMSRPRFSGSLSRGLDKMLRSCTLTSVR